MAVINYKLDVFEGPLDVLLMLVHKHKLNIRDIEISVLLEQFLAYLDELTQADIEVTSEFLEMAAQLILIKSASLLPREEAEQMKRELEGALIELALAKAMAEKLRKRYLGDVVFVREPAKIEIDATYRRIHQPEELLLAYEQLSDKNKRKAEMARRPVKPVVAKSYVTVFTGIVSVLKSLRKNGIVEMNDLYEGMPRSRKVATFLAILELSKDGRIIISDDGESIKLADLPERKEGAADEV
ncbi:MAG: segregation and condensation protein A [Oscillospiraceae bacterium]